MKKIIASAFLLIFGLNLAYSQDAKKILDEVAEKSKTYKTLQGTFQYKLENKSANLYENSEGIFKIKKTKYFVDVLGAKTYYDGKLLYSFIEDVNEVTIQSPEEDSEDFLNASNLFTIYQRGYTYKYVGKIVENGESIHIIDLFPKSDETPYKKLIVKISCKTNILSSIKSIGKSGDNVEISILSMKENTPIPDSAFSFNESEYPDVEIIDMR